MKIKIIFIGVIVILLSLLLYQYYSNDQKEEERYNEYMSIQQLLQEKKDSLEFVVSRLDSISRIRKIDYEESKDSIEKIIYVPYTSIDVNDRRDTIRAIINEGE